MWVEASAGNFSFLINFHLSGMQLTKVHRFWRTRLLSIYLRLGHFNVKFDNAGDLLKWRSWTWKGLRGCLYRGCTFLKNLVGQMLSSLKYFPCLFLRFLWPLGTRSFAHWRFSLLHVLRGLINSRALGDLRAFAFSLPNPSMVLGIKDKHRAVVCWINHLVHRHPPRWLVFGL